MLSKLLLLAVFQQASGLASNTTPQSRHKNYREISKAETGGNVGAVWSVCGSKRSAVWCRSSSLESSLLTPAEDDVTALNPESRSRRQVSKIQKFPRLPVWPAWNGVFIFLVSKAFGEEAAAKLEDAIGGRVCPNFFDPQQTSPFIMLVHHRHSFALWDPLRFLQRTFFPEGFPAHPHRGFVTVTYCLKGGMIHRDSLGLKQTYGAEERHGGKHTQWLTAGAGILHEEMWDIQPDKGGIPFLQPSSQELFQLWLNLPSKYKMQHPEAVLLGGETETPSVVHDSTKTIIIAGQHAGRVGSIQPSSDVGLYHVQMKPGSHWWHKMPATQTTGIIYMRTGSAQVGGERIPPQYVAYLNQNGDELHVVADSRIGADFLLLTGEPILEPFQAQGTMVMNHPHEINEAYRDYQIGKMGMPWKHNMSDNDWMEHVRMFPSAYNTRHKK